MQLASLAVNSNVVPISGSGIVTLTIQSATNFVWDDRLPRPNQLVASVSLGWTKIPIYTTPPSRCTPNQLLAWNSAFDFICYERPQTIVVIKIVDDAPTVCSSNGSTVYGHFSVALDELLIAQDVKQRYSWPLSGCPHGALNMSVQWKSMMQMKQTRVYTPSDGSLVTLTQKACAIYYLRTIYNR